MDLIAQKSNESYYGTHKVHMKGCSLIEDLTPENTFTFWDQSCSIIGYPEAVQKAKETRPGLKVIPCHECLKTYQDHSE
ncbi:hypothetical protein [Lactococcus lactis]|uniref:hypothetical protein n=1 Tax=Lactococcus lactis TaxID=1358 RepID=UPI0028900ADE|nr:hypothetical protein [Lactococcus lactis]MDT2903337.1 hypothetical protein [Lactococcus lactis]